MCIKLCSLATDKILTLLDFGLIEKFKPFQNFIAFVLNKKDCFNKATKKMVVAGACIGICATRLSFGVVSKSDDKENITI